MYLWECSDYGNLPMTFQLLMLGMSSMYLRPLRSAANDSMLFTSFMTTERSNWTSSMSNRPLSTLEKSRMSFMIPLGNGVSLVSQSPSWVIPFSHVQSKPLALLCMFSAHSRWSFVSSPMSSSSKSSDMPMTPAMGVRISWLMFARN
jgi:hypothetical protein